MKRIMAGAVAVCVVLSVSAAMAQEGLAWGTEYAAAVKVGTPGYGLEVSTPLVKEEWDLRACLNYFGYSVEQTEEADEPGKGSDTVNVDLTLLTLGVLGDWHPWANNFRLTAGLFWNGNSIELSVKPGDMPEFNDREYAVSDFTGEVAFNGVCPYFGIGTGNPFGGAGNWFFTFDVGVMYHGTPQFDVSARALNPAEQAALDRDIEIETQDMEDDLAAFVVYPVISAGLTYKF